MATTATAKPVLTTGGAHDRAFYSGMSILMACVVFIGFARTYYLSAYFGTHATTSGRPFSTIVRIHAALFTTWVLLFLVQTSLVASRRVAVHRRLGVAVAALATALDLARHGGAPPGVEPVAFLVVPLGDMTMFAVLIVAALVLRRNKEAHKRLMLLAYTSILVAAVARFPGILAAGPLWFFGLTFLTVLALAMTYDFVTRRRIHPAYIWGGGLLILSVPGRLALSTTQAWHHLAQKLLGS